MALSEQEALHQAIVPPKPPFIAPGHSPGTVTEKISEIVLTRKTPRWWFVGFGIAFILVMGFLYAVTKLVFEGTGLWGVNIPVGWGFAIVNFVWWIGIGHAGTLISAILLLLRQSWRTSINRFAEAMTIFAVACAGIFPIIHTGRPWLAYWLLPYPNTMGVWPNFRSPLVWDVFAVSTYATVSLLFWYMGLIPDLATLRDRAQNKPAQIIYGMLSMGWRGGSRHWQNYETAYLLMAGIATPLVLSVHTVVSFDFAAGVVPGWHTTIFPPYFVAGAIFAGFAMVLTLTLPLRAVFGLQDFITQRHVQNMAKVMLATGLIVAYGYIIEAFTGWYSGSHYEHFMMLNRIKGPYGFQYAMLWLCNILAPQVLWIRFFRTNPVALWIVAMFVNVGMWLERYIIVITSLHRDFLPSSWGEYAGTRFDWMIFVGTLGLFVALLFLFIRFLPMISIAEMRHMAHQTAHSSGTKEKA
ncbi:MAG: NrfD/PsrC family molybdoenzyme membrane anchor subunit [Acidobacteriota bacterium]